ncbi:MAG TPA: flagellar motor protein MotB [Roseococcus sp.]|nr:flagellar motor protein MotB [Roseococcus sp.]
MAKRGRNDGATIVIKRIEEAGHGHHGGAWKVAYADFVTAMMAFFLLMWLLNATTEEQRRGLADYFNPNHAMSNGSSGTGQPFGGSTPNDTGRMASTSGSVRVERGPRPVLLDLEEEDDSDRPAEPFPRREGPAGDADTPPERTARAGGEGEGRDDARSALGREGTAAESQAARLTDQALAAELARREQAGFEAAAAQLRDTLRSDPALAEVARQTLIEIVPQGLRIQLLEADGQPMFAPGGALPTERARGAIRAVAQAALRLGNPVSITGHTDATPFRAPPGGAQPGRTNWDLSADRANATRRLLQEGGLPDARIAGVTGMADREPLLPAQPAAAGNRRVSVTLLRQLDAPAAPVSGARPS